MKNIVVLSHDASVSPVDLSARVKELTTCEFSPVTINGVKCMKYGCSTSETSVCLCVGKGDGWQLKIKDELTHELKVIALTYDKRLFRPGELHLTLSCNTSSIALPIDSRELFFALKSALKGDSTVPYTIVHFLGFTGPNTSTKAGDLISVCKNYYVHNFNVIKKGGQTQVELHCYSFDKLLTLDKYSKVYQGETFGGKLFDGMVKPASLVLNYKIENLVNVKEVVTADSIKEVQFPYLVQYNESYYDFLCRIAVRCGEFLYHENGKLTLGLEKQGCPDVMSLDNIDVQYPNVMLAETVGTSIDAYPGSSMSGFERKDEMILSERYNCEYINDDFLTAISKEDNQKIYDALYAWEKFIYGATGETLSKATSVDSFISTFVSSFCSSIADAGINKSNLEKAFKKSVENYLNDMGISKPNFLTNEKLYEFERDETYAQDNMVKLDYGSAIPNIKLGSPININDGVPYYFATHIHGSIYTEQISGMMKSYARDNHVELVPVFKRTRVTKTLKDGTYVLGSEEYNAIVPPHYDIPRVRKAEAQEAIVCDTADPLLLGRVRVKFLWQKDEVFTPWIRVTVPYVGGKSGGMNMIPEKNDHLMVNFIGGNIEMPYVEGFLFDKSTRPAAGAGLLATKYGSKAKRKVISSSLGHAITFTDIVDKSSILNMLCPPVAAILNMVHGAKKQFGNKTDSMSVDEHWAPLTGGINLRDPNGIYEVDLSAKTRSITVNSPFGNVSISAFTGITIDAPNGDVKIRGKNVSIEAGNSVTITSGQNIKSKKFDAATGGILATSAIGNTILSVGYKSLVAGLPWMSELTKLTDLSFLRSSWEVLLRPVDGTLRIQSKRNTIITAGKGEVAIPKNFMSSEESKAKFVEKQAILTQYNNILQSLKNTFENKYHVYTGVLNGFVGVFITTIVNKIPEIANGIKNDKKAEIGLDEHNVVNQVVLCRMIIKGKNLPNWVDICKPIGQQYDINQNILNETNYNSIVASYNNIKKIYNDLNGFRNDFERVMMGLFDANSFDNSFLKGLWDDYKLYNIDINAEDGKALREVTWSDETKKQAWREIVVAFMDANLKGKFQWKKPKDFNRDHNITDEQWEDLVSSFTEKNNKELAPLSALADRMLGGFTNFAQYGCSLNALYGGTLTKMFNIHGVNGPFAVWEVANKGQVLISNSPGQTVLLNDRSDGWDSKINHAKMEALKNLLNTY